MLRYCSLFLMALVGCNQAAPPAAVVETTTVVEVANVDPPKNEDTPPAKLPPIPAPMPFAFPDDTGGKLLAQLLPPSAPPIIPPVAPTGPRVRALPSYLEAPTPAFGETASSIPRFATPPTKPVMPNALPDRVPVDLAPLMPQLPERSAWPTGPLSREPARDLNQSNDLPLLSLQPVPDRAPLADPTVEFTAQSVISTNLPLRIEQTPFLRLLLPDPFEHNAGRARTALLDDPNRALGNPPPPKP